MKAPKTKRRGPTLEQLTEKDKANLCHLFQTIYECKRRLRERGLA